MVNETEERKQRLIAEIMNDGTPGDFGKNMERAEELSSLHDGEGTTVDMILNELLSRKASGDLRFFSVGSPVYFLLTVVEKLASPRHATRVAEFLSWDELVLGDNRTYRMLVPEILEKIGDQSVVPALEAFAKRVKTIRYSHSISFMNDTIIPGGEYNKMDQDNIARAIKACQAR